MSPATKIQIYLPDHARQAIDLDAPQPPPVSRRLTAVCDRYEYLVRWECPAFSRAEWSLMLDACNGWASWSEAGETLMVGIAAEIEDHIRLNQADEHWGLTAEQAGGLVRRLRSLSAVETMAVLERIERFWRRCDAETGAAMMGAWIHPSDAPELAFEVVGRTVHHRAAPRFILAMKATSEGGWENDGPPRWLDEFEPDASKLAHLMRLAGDAWAAWQREFGPQAK